MIKYIDIVTLSHRHTYTRTLIIKYFTLWAWESCDASTVVNHSIFLWKRFIFVANVIKSKLIIAILSRFVCSKQSYLFIRMSLNAPFTVLFHLSIGLIYPPIPFTFCAIFFSLKSFVWFTAAKVFVWSRNVWVFQSIWNQN